MLNTMAVSVEGSGANSLDQVRPLLKRQQKYWNYTNIFMTDENGRAYDLQDKERLLTLDEDVRENILNGTEAMSMTQMIDGDEYILFFVPLNGVEIRGVKMVALAASYDPASFDQVLNMKSSMSRLIHR